MLILIKIESPENQIKKYKNFDFYCLPFVGNFGKFLF